MCISRIFISLVFGAFFLAIPLSYNFQNNDFVIAKIYADEAQEMIDRAPAIIQAAYSDDWNEVIKLAKSRNKNLLAVDDMGNTVLHIAAESAGDDVIVALLKLGADKNAKTSLYPPQRPYDCAKYNKKISSKVRAMLK